MYRCTEYISRFPPVLLFCFKYKVPWIVKWSYQIKSNILIRNFTVKCWDNFDRDRIIKFVYDEFPEIKQVEDQSSSSIPDLLKGKSPEELVEISSSEGSTTEMINLSQFSAPVKKNWYEESLFQDAQDPYAGIEEDAALIEEQYLG
uniref:Uncharacterized protein n=1 Tax=Fagus sylvatica TaxID=28930 RepID=A0A2N9IUH3_FAGSY